MQDKRVYFITVYMRNGVEHRVRSDVYAHIAQYVERKTKKLVWSQAIGLGIALALFTAFVAWRFGH